MNKTPALIAATVASLLLSACAEKEAETNDDANQLVRCEGINECSGQSECASEGGNSCEGLNECAGKGWITVTQEECDTEGGTVLEGEA